MNNNFFNTKNPIFTDLLEVENVWDPLKKLEAYLQSLFDERKIKANFKEYVFVDPSASVDPTVKIEGPAIIGKNTTIKYNVYIRENVIVGENCNIGHASELKSCLIMDGTQIAHFNYVGDSIFGESVNFGAGAKTANFRFDEGEIYVQKNLEKINTHLKKFGAVVGDNAKIGVNSVLNPGTLLEKDCVVYPLTMVTGHHKSSSRIK